MDQDKALVVFQDKKIRRIWHQEQWFFSVVDVVNALEASTIPKRYWSDLKAKLSEEGFELYDKIVQLKLPAEDEKLNVEEISEIQKELAGVSVAEEYADYRLSDTFVDIFIQEYGKAGGDYGYIQRAVLLSLFTFIRKKFPNISQDDLITKSQRLYPVVRAMIQHSNLITLIKKAASGKTS